MIDNTKQIYTNNGHLQMTNSYTYSLSIQPRNKNIQLKSLDNPVQIGVYQNNENYIFTEINHNFIIIIKTYYDRLH